MYEFDFLQPQLFLLFIQRFDCLEIGTSVRPRQNIKIILVHPKHKVDDSKNTDCLYQIHCKSCSHTYIGETGRPFGTRLEEHRKEVENITTIRFTREEKRGQR